MASVKKSGKKVQRLKNIGKTVKPPTLNDDSLIGDDEEFNLDDVLSLGGSKEDYDMLNNLKSEQNKSIPDEKALKNEIEIMVKSLGLDSIELEDERDRDADDDNEDDDDNSFDELETEVGIQTKRVSQKTEVNRTSPIAEISQKEEQISESKSKDRSSLKAEKILYIPSFEKQQKQLVQPYEQWYEQLPPLDVLKCDNTNKDPAVGKVQDIAKQYWENEVQIYQEKKNAQKSSNAKWLRTVLSSGTLSDRVAAITMLLQESPVHQMKCLENLVSMAKKKGRREAIMAIDSLRNLWTSSFLPDRKLRYFWQWPISQIKEICKDSGKYGEAKMLILWYFEDLLKAKCAEFIDALETLSRDTIVGIRDKTAGALYELLAMKPEQEQKLLTTMINKLGDPARKVASRVSYLLGQLVIKHPNMKLIVIEEVERLLYRPNVSSKTQYYAICFLNQIILTNKESAVASKLISIYFSFFKSYASSNSSETKMLSALLSGVNRAYPYVQDKEERYDDQLDVLFKICHNSSFSTSVQAIMLLFQVMQSRRTVTDRYYRVLYEKLLDGGVNTTTKRTMFLNIIYKSIKADSSLNRVKAFFKRLLQTGFTEDPTFACGILFLLSEVMKVQTGVKSLTMQPEEDDDEEHFEDVIEDSFTAPNEEDSKQMKIKAEIEKGEESEHLDNKSGWTFRGGELKRDHYDIHNRNPLYCGAQFSCAWELHPFTKHYHPSVNRFAQSVLDDKPIDYKGDPLQDFTLARFLDRFMYKNPKKNQKEHGGSIMQPRKMSERLKELPVNSKEFTQKKISNIREDEIFFYRYFKRKAEVEESKNKKDKKPKIDEDLAFDEEESDDEADFDFASEIQKTKETRPKTKRKKSGDDDDDEENDHDDDHDDDYDNDEDMSVEGEFEYDNMEFSEEEDFDEDVDDEAPKKGRKKNFSDADYEKALFENLSDSDINDENEDARDTGNPKIMSMFAAADEFAHLLEDSGTSKGQQKQAHWEERNTNWKSFKKYKGRPKLSNDARPGSKRKRNSGNKDRKGNKNSLKGKGGATRKYKGRKK